MKKQEYIDHIIYIQSKQHTPVKKRELKSK